MSKKKNNTTTRLYWMIGVGGGLLLLVVVLLMSNGLSGLLGAQVVLDLGVGPGKGACYHKTTRLDNGGTHTECYDQGTEGECLARFENRLSYNLFHATYACDPKAHKIYTSAQSSDPKSRAGVDLLVTCLEKLAVEVSQYKEDCKPGVVTTLIPPQKTDEVGDTSNSTTTCATLVKCSPPTPISDPTTIPVPTGASNSGAVQPTQLLIP